MVQVLPHPLVEAALLLIRVLWNLHHLVVALPEAGLPLAVEVVVLLIVRVLLAEFDPEIAAVVVLALETATAVAVHQASAGVDPAATAVGVFVAGIALETATAVAAAVFAVVLSF